MANAGDIIIDGLLCFASSALNDFSRESLNDLTYAFYSHENIKASKTTLCNLLHKDIIWRRDPDKKRKDLKDVIDYLKEVLDSKIKVKFVSDNYRQMPAVGMECIAPLLINLSGELDKINGILPGILDVKSEVINTADTVRQLRSDVIDLKGKFSSAVTGMQEATKDFTEEDISMVNDLKSLRKSLSNLENLGNSRPIDDNVNKRDRLSFGFAGALQSPINDLINTGRHANNYENNFNSPPLVRTTVTDRSTGAVTKTFLNNSSSSNNSTGKNSNSNKIGKSQPAAGSQDNTKETSQIVIDLQKLAADSRQADAGSHHGGLTVATPPPEQVRREEEEEVVVVGVGGVGDAALGADEKAEGDDGIEGKNKWVLVQNKRKRRNSRQSTSDKDSRKNGQFKVMGSRKTGQSSFRAAVRTADIFLGRVENDVNTEDIVQHIKEMFNVTVINIESVEIRTDEHKAFKITVDRLARHTLFKPESWPEGVIVNKYYHPKRDS